MEDSNSNKAISGPQSRTEPKTDKVSPTRQPKHGAAEFTTGDRHEMKTCENLPTTSCRTREHVKDAKQRFRNAMIKHDGPKNFKRQISDSNPAEHIPTPRGNVLFANSKSALVGELGIFRGNLCTESRSAALKGSPTPDLPPDNRAGQSCVHHHSSTFIKPDDSVKLDLKTSDGDRVSLTKTASRTLLSVRQGGKEIVNDEENGDSNPPLTPRYSPRTLNRHDFIPLPGKSGERLPMLSLSAKEDLIKEIAPGLLLKSKDTALSSSRSSVASSASSVQSSVTSVISLTELKTLRVNCRVSEDAIVSTATNKNTSNSNSSKAGGVTSVITSNMSVTDMKRVLLGRSRVRGVEPANFCVIAVRTPKVTVTVKEEPDQDTEDEMIQVETEILSDDAHPFEEKGRHFRRAKFSIRPGRGKVVDVYDGRKWPVVRCGSVYITPSDSAVKVVQAVLATPSVKEKKRRAAKYTVAVGTSHGHVQTFLKDSAVVLSAFDECPAEEKCLMLIKRPKEYSRKLWKAQSAQNLSMSDSQLHRQFDGTAFNSPYTAHRLKPKPKSAIDDNSEMASEVYNTEPRVRRAAGPPAVSAAHKKWPAARANNTFVPIPELGIFTPEQHVLQNGTYAQHCHLREVNNNNNNSNGNVGRRSNGGYYEKKSMARRTGSNDENSLGGSKSYGNQNGNNSSFNSSFDESVSSYGYASAKGVLRGYDPAAVGGVPNSGAPQYPVNDEVYHSCVDISYTYRKGAEREFNTLNNRQPYGSTYAPAPIIKNELRDRRRSPDRSCGKQSENEAAEFGSSRLKEAEGDAKMDAAARSYSLGDLSARLTFSLVGENKTGSVTAVNAGDRGGRRVYSPGLSSKTAHPAPLAASISSSDREESSSALKHIKDRLQKAVFKSQARGNASSNQPCRTSQNGEPINHSYQQRFDNKASLHHPTQRPDEHYMDQQKLYQQQAPVPESSQGLMALSRNRRDSEDTVSSYRSAQSDTSKYHSSQDLPPTASSIHDASHSAGKVKKHNAVNKSNINGFTSSATLVLNNNNETRNAGTNHSSKRDSTSSPSKPKRSLPNVPLSETSERIKRFTEMMRSRMYTGSRAESSNGSRSGSSTKQTPIIMSNESACSHTSLSRKSSMETASDSEVFTINGGGGENIVREAHATNRHQQHNVLPNQYPDSHQRRGHNLCEGSNKISKDASHEVQKVSKGFAGPNQSHTNHRPFTSEDTPLLPGDRSTDSGQTTGTNHSYNGSAMDSGYTTNNDADNDSFNTNNQYSLQNHQPFHNRDTFYHQQHQPQDPSHPQHHPPYINEAQNQYKSASSSAQLVKHQQHLSSKSQNSQPTHGFKPTDWPQTRYKSNLTSAHRFGSVQNVSSAQAHGNPHDNFSLPISKSPPSRHLQQRLSRDQRYDKGPFSAREQSAKHNYQNNLLSGQSQHLLPHLEGRRSWDFADAHLHFDSTGYESNLKKSDRKATHYKSSEVISSTKPLFTNANYVNANHIHSNIQPSNHKSNIKSAPTLQEQSQTLSAKFRSMQLSNGTDQQLYNQGFVLHSGFNGTNSSSQRVATSGLLNPSSSSTSHDNNDNTSQGFRNNAKNNVYQPHSDNHYQQQHHHKNGSGPGAVDSKGNVSQFPDHHQLHPTSHYHHQSQQHQQNQTNSKLVKLRPVPVSRVNRTIRGRTLPGSFRFTDAEIAAAGEEKNSTPDASISQHSKALRQDNRQEVMLFHLTQSFDLCPLLVNLPRHVSLRDLAKLSDFLIEISLVGTPGSLASPLGGPNSPQGPKASKIGSPGSAFSPVRNSQDFEGSGGEGAGEHTDASKVTSTKVKVIQFTRVWGEELQRHTTLGRLLEGDIVVEVNGWFCLGVDTAYLANVVESCQGTITFTIARPKDVAEKRVQGQTPTERVKGLEAEISRLDEIIKAKDEKMREMASLSGNSTKQLAAISAINGRIPVEGMVIGDDEYVV